MEYDRDGNAARCDVIGWVDIPRMMHVERTRSVIAPPPDRNGDQTGTTHSQPLLRVLEIEARLVSIVRGSTSARCRRLSRGVM
jgi:hypothetical protein